jgi:hypothetical protein
MEFQAPFRVFFGLFALSLLTIYGCGDGHFSPELAGRVPKKPDFNYHVKPILSDKCFACHGPDEQKIEAGLQFHEKEKATMLLTSGKKAIVPGKLSQSELYQRILSDDPDLVMPPPESNLMLTEEEKVILTRWIKQGAEYKPHWSFISPQTPELPKVNRKEWIRNPIDQFVLARLEKEDLTPSPDADKLTLIRRVSFDLTGLPPSLEEIDQFLADNSENAYEKVVDRLLASPHYGERMAMDWLDVARYADSHGFHADGYRMMWPWRDWVIRAFNDNLPFDDFITWQLAGDLLPDPSREQLLATGFNRNNPVNSESGIDPEEYRLESVFDRTNTTAKALLGLTMECARCHDHKYDPIAQKEFYQFSAFFNNVDELGMMSVDGNAAPTMLLMTDDVSEIAEYIECEIGVTEERLQAREQEVLSKGQFADIKMAPTYQQDGLLAHYTLDKIQNEKTPNSANPQQEARISGEVEVVTGYQGKALRFDSEYEHFSLPDVGDFERTQTFSMGAWVYPEGRSDYRVILSNAGHKNEHWRGYEMYLDGKNRLAVRLTHRPPDNRVEVLTLDSIPMKSWSHVFFSYDGSSRAAGLRIYLNGRPVRVQTTYDRLEQSIRSIDAYLNIRPRPVRVGKSYRIALELGVFEGAIDEIRIYDRQLTAPEVAGLVGNTYGSEAEEQAGLVDYYLHHQDTIYQNILKELGIWQEKRHRLLDTIPEVMVMREMEQPRKTYVLDRGAYDAPAEEVSAGTPDWILPFPEDLPNNRLGLAQWLTRPEHPLTSRVLVNRYWHQLFGRGIVSTLEDFGNQGALPTHPELLDWLALEFIQSNWDLKSLIRTIVTSATYRQSSEAGQELIKIDPENELLARGPRHRLPAEMIRDNALVAAGLLVEKIGGPSVKTYQPEGIWDNTHFSKLLTKYKPDEGEALYRRSLYTFIRRTAPPPTMTVMDAPDRSMCVVRRQNTSTPLQALLLMNEPQLLEAGRLIAERVIREARPHTADQLNYAFRLLSGRNLTNDEAQLLGQLFQEEYQRFCADESAATALLSVGAFPGNDDLPAAEVAALATVTNVMMNFYDTYTKK